MASEAPGWGVCMMPQDTPQTDATLWDTRVLFYSSSPKLPVSIIGTSLISRKCGLPLLWMMQAGGIMSLGSSPTYVDPFSSWIFSGDTGDAFVYIYPSAPDYRQFTLQLNASKSAPVMAAGTNENWWFVPHDGGNRSDPVMFMSAIGNETSLAGGQDGSVFLNQPQSEAVQPGNGSFLQWRLITPLVNGIPLNTQLIRNEAYGTYLHCGGIGQGLNLVRDIPPDHETYGPCLWSPGITPVTQGFDIPNPSMGGAMATVASWKPGVLGIYLQYWQETNNVNQLWTFRR